MTRDFLPEVLRTGEAEIKKLAQPLWRRLLGPAGLTRGEWRAVLLTRRWPSLVVGLPGGKRIDRVLSAATGVPPRLLSSRTAVPPLNQPRGLLQRFRQWLWLRNSARGSAWAALLLAFDVLVISAVAGVSSNSFRIPNDPPVAWASPDLVPLAAYAGGIFGFLLTVLVFVTQIRSQRDSSMLPLTTMWARKYHAFEILALSAGVAISNLLAAMLWTVVPMTGLPADWVERLYGPLQWINLALFPTMTVLSLWMLASIIADAGNTDTQAMAPVIQAALADAAREDSRRVASANQFASELEERGLRYNPYAHGELGRVRSVRVDLDIGRSGIFADIDCYALDRLQVLCDRTDGLAIEFAALPGHAWSVSHGAVAVLSRDDSAEGTIDNIVKSQLERALRRAVLITPRARI